MLLFDFDFSALQTLIEDLATKATPVVLACITAGFGIWGLLFIARKARRAIS